MSGSKFTDSQRAALEFLRNQIVEKAKERSTKDKHFQRKDSCTPSIKDTSDPQDMSADLARPTIRYAAVNHLKRKLEHTVVSALKKSKVDRPCRPVVPTRTQSAHGGPFDSQAFRKSSESSELKLTAGIQGRGVSNQHTTTATYTATAVNPTRALLSAKTSRGTTTGSKVPRGLYNKRQACHQNSVSHVLSQMPEFAGLKVPLMFAFALINPLSDKDLIIAAEGKGSGRTGPQKVLAEFLENRKSEGSLKLSAYFADTMKKTSSTNEKNLIPHIPHALHQVCGKVLGDEFNGAAQQDDAVFSMALIEAPDQELGTSYKKEVFGATFEERRTCGKCGAIKTAVRHNLQLEIPQASRNAGSSLKLGRMIGRFLQAEEDFGLRSCDKCVQRRNWIDVEGWTGIERKRISFAPRYLAFQIQCGEFRGARGEVVETIIHAKVQLPTRPIKMKTADGAVV